MALTERLAYILSVDASGAVGFDKGAVSAERLAIAQARAQVAADKLAVAEARAAVVEAKAAGDADKLAAAQERASAAAVRLATSQGAANIASAQGGIAKAERDLQGLTTAGGGATSMLGRLVPGLGAVGSSGAAAAAGPLAVGAAAVAAGAAVEKFASGSISTFAALGQEVDRYQDLAGGTTEQASRMVVTFRNLNIETETGAKSMAFLGREVEGGNKALDKYGISVARNRDGTVDLNGTLLNVADAYQRTGDQAEKDAILMAAFGRQGVALTDVLEKGRSGLEQFWQAAENHGELLSEEDRQAAIQFDRSIADLKQAWQGIQVAAGKELIPIATLLAHAGTKTLDFVNDLHLIKPAIEAGLATIPLVGPIAAGAVELVSHHMHGLKTTADETVPSLKSVHDELATQTDTLSAAQDAVDAYNSALNGVTKAQKGVTDAAGAQARKQADIAKANQDGTRATEDLTRAEQKLEDARRQAPIDLAKARDTETESTHKLTEATRDAAAAVLRYGAESQQAIDAQDKLASAKDDHAQAQEKLDELERNKAHPSAVQDAERQVADAKERQAAAAERKTKADQEDPLAEQAAASEQLRQAEEARDKAWRKIQDQVDAVNSLLGTQYTIQDAIDGKLKDQLAKIQKIKDDAAAAVTSIAAIIAGIPDASKGVASIIGGAGQPAPPPTTGSGAVGAIIGGQPTAQSSGTVINNTFNIQNPTDPVGTAQEIIWAQHGRPT
jgi:hypothetical protein